MKQLFIDQPREKKGFHKPLGWAWVCSPSKVPAAAQLARHTLGGRGRVSPCSSQEQTLNIAAFLSSAKLCQAPGMGALPQKTDWPDASWLALLFSSFRFYTLSTLLLSLLNPRAPDGPASLARPLSVILPFLSLQTFSQFFSSMLSKVTQLGWIRVGPSCAESCREGREAQDRGCSKGWHTPGLPWVRKTFKCSWKKGYSKSSKCCCLCQNRMKTRFQTALRGQSSSVEWNAREVSSCLDCQCLTSFSPVCSLSILQQVPAASRQRVLTWVGRRQLISSSQASQQKPFCHLCIQASHCALSCRS